MPMMATSGGFAWTARRHRGHLYARRAWALPPTATSRWSSAIGADPVTERRHLADHVHAFGLLRLLARLHEPSCLSVCRRARTSPFEAIRSRPRFSISSSSRISSGVLSASARSRRCSRRNASPNGVSAHRVAWPGPVSSRTVRVHASASRWKPGHDGRRSGRPLGEEVGRTEQDAHPRAPFGERGGQAGDHGGRPRIVDATGEHDVILARHLGRRAPCSAGRPIISSQSTKLDRGPT